MMSRNARHIVAIGPDLDKSLKQAIYDALWGNNCSLLIGFIEKLTNLSVSGVLVYGSLAFKTQNDGFGKSDADLLVLVDERVEGGVFGRSDDLDVDLHIQTRNETTADVEKNHIFFGSRVLFDVRSPELNNWLKYLIEWRVSEAGLWTDADRLRERVWAQRLLRSVMRESSSDSVSSAMHEARLLAALPTLYAVARQKHTTSISQWWREVQLTDKVLVDELKEYVTEREVRPPGAAMEDLLKLIVTGGNK